MICNDYVHATSYLFSEEIDLSALEKDSNECFKLNEGYEILSLSVEILEIGEGTLDIGIESNPELFLDNISLSTKEVYKSRQEKTIATDTHLILKTSARSGKIKIRAHYFTKGKMQR